MNATTPQYFLNRLALTLIFLIQIVWHMPGTIALRNILLVIFVLVTLGILVNESKSEIFKMIVPKVPLALLALLTAWILLVNLLWGDYPQLNWAEFKSQWLLPVACFVFAWLYTAAANSRYPGNNRSLLLVVFVAYFIPVVVHDLLSLVYLQETGALPFRNAPFFDLPDMISKWSSLPSLAAGFSGQNPGFFSYVNSILSAFLVAELVQRFLNKKPFIAVPTWLIVFGLVMVLFCSYVLRMRNGNVGLLMLLVFTSLMLAHRLSAHIRPWRIIASLAAFLILMTSAGYALIKSDERWLGLVDTVPYAWDTQLHKAWLLGEPYPIMPNGKLVEISAYERTAWLKEGLLLLEERPLGSGYDRNAWGGRLVDKYQVEGKSRGGHSHNGILDFAIATGIAGVMMWLGFIGSLAWLGFAAFRAGLAMPGMLMIFIVTGYFGRTLVDSVIRDHFLQVFMFLSGVLSCICLTKPSVQNRSNDDA